ncbi:MAG: type II toxin-antitoxin system RelE/ParE family toxin [Verrucomicrobia bacterium]|nr:type II toxin-antitoxin system RelE/ParE family toxin [Verrucomicrobiota bacterium]MCH8511521.1 type II toxin-antitoxin system RelE/ParE family toxin [Kiritimatiellia bacterium]
MLPLVIARAAVEEFQDAVVYYNQERPGLGYEFASEVKSAFQRIKEFPDAWPVFHETSRRCFLQRFPYGILYKNYPNQIFVAAIMHLRRDPKHWEIRLKTLTETDELEGGVIR